MPGVLILPKGRPSTGSERTIEWQLRKKGVLPPLPTCSACGAQLKVGCGSGKASEMGLCYKCYRATPEYKEAAKQQKRLKRLGVSAATEVPDLEAWPVGYFSAKQGEELVKHDRLRTAIGYAFDRSKDNGPVFIVWSDGRVTEHYGLTAKNSKGMTPDHWSACEIPPDNPGWFLAQIPPEKQIWFES